MNWVGPVPAERLKVVESPALPRGFLRKGEAAASRVYVNPLGRFTGAAPALSQCEVLIRADGEIASTPADVDAVRDWAWTEGEDVGNHVNTILDHLQAPREEFAGLSLAAPLVMGIVNVTPDSFSDGGETPDAGTATERGLAMVGAGAAIVDVGGESARPGADPLPVDEEKARTLPVVSALAEAGIVVSIDTRHASVMEATIKAGARIINDVTALTDDAGSLGTAAESGAPVVLMHMQGFPATMQADPTYDHAALDVYDYLAGRISACAAVGISTDRIAVDPGIGFGKTVADNLELVQRCGLFHGLGCAVLLGASRKTFIGRLGGGAEPQDRIAGSIAVALAAVDRGAQILRVHDVAETRQALDAWLAVHGANHQALA